MTPALLARLRELMGKAKLELPLRSIPNPADTDGRAIVDVKGTYIATFTDAACYPSCSIFDGIDPDDAEAIVALVNAADDLLAAAEREAKWTERMPRCSHDMYTDHGCNAAATWGRDGELYSCDAHLPENRQYWDELPWADLVRGE